MRGRLGLFPAFVFALGAAAPVYAVPLGPYQIVTLGLTDAEHTHSSGYRFSLADHLDDSGLVSGFSSRFIGDTQAGGSAWLYDSATSTTTRVGFFGAGYSRDDGVQESFVEFLEDGVAVGSSHRYDGALETGWAVWAYDSADASTTRIGYFDAVHTATDGFQASTALQLVSGLVAGSSERFNGADYLGQTAWLYDTAADTTTRVGFLDPEHTRSDGTQVSYVNSLGETGLAVGSSERFDGASSHGYSAWRYDSATATTTQLGFLDAEHTRSDGYRDSGAELVNGAGLVSGYSERYAGAAAHGFSAWLHESGGATTTRVGFVDAEHTRDDGYQSSFVARLSESGFAAGISQRFDGGADDLGQSAWLHDSATAATSRLGLLDAAHTAADGRQYSVVEHLNESGLAAGYSERWNAADFAGLSAWLHDPATDTSTRIGLFDAVHTRSDGLQESLVTHLSNAGLAAGVSSRYAGAAWVGQSGWIYDATSGDQYTIVLSTKSDGTAQTSISFLGEDGLALGSYQAYDALDDPLGSRAFAWTAEEGAVDLGALVSGGLGAAGWARLADALRADPLGRIVGFGQRGDLSDLAYLLVPVPEPSALLLLAAGLAGVALVTRSG